ncbi:hypothetical protein ACS0TY_012982 [Phlomoides rotata]
MKRVWKFSEFEKCLKIARSSLYTHDRIAKPLIPIRFICQNATPTPHADENRASVSYLASLFTQKLSYNGAEMIPRKSLNEEVCKLKDGLLKQDGDVDKIGGVLEEFGAPLFRRYPNGSAVLSLLTQLRAFPSLALEVFVWRREHPEYVAPMTRDEYAKGISIAGRLKNVDLAVEFFKEASNKELKGTSLFNALMSAYSYNGFTFKCQSLFRDLKADPACTPSIITYNILIAAYGRLVLVDHMEVIHKELKDLNLEPNVFTYVSLISGYITAWMWEEMEATYQAMKAGPIKPNLNIHLLMLRGYAVAGKLEKMEEYYEMLMDCDHHIDIHLIRVMKVMIRAYCKSSDAERVRKVEQLLMKIPQSEYRPWLNVSLIYLYAKEDLLEQMETSINEAFEHQVYVKTVGVMNAIIGCYFRHNAVDKLADFVKCAEVAGWKRCRSLYHCKMVLYSSQMRLSEMERVLEEMHRINMHFSKKTYWILVKAYYRWDEMSKLKQVVGMMWKHGYKVHLAACN